MPNIRTTSFYRAHALSIMALLENASFTDEPGSLQEWTVFI